MREEQYCFDLGTVYQIVCTQKIPLLVEHPEAHPLADAAADEETHFDHDMLSEGFNSLIRSY